MKRSRYGGVKSLGFEGPTAVWERLEKNLFSSKARALHVHAHTAEESSLAGSWVARKSKAVGEYGSLSLPSPSHHSPEQTDRVTHQDRPKSFSECSTSAGLSSNSVAERERERQREECEESEVAPPGEEHFTVSLSHRDTYIRKRVTPLVTPCLHPLLGRKGSGISGGCPGGPGVPNRELFHLAVSDSE